LEQIIRGVLSPSTKGSNLLRTLFTAFLILINFSFSFELTDACKAYLLNSKKGDHFRVYYPNNERNRVGEVLNTAEQAYKEIAQIFPNTLASVDILIFASTADYNRLLGWQCRAPNWSKGLYRKDAIILINPDNKWTKYIVPHELTHVFIYDISRNIPNWLNEGLAQYLAKDDYFYNGQSSEYLLRQAVKSKTLVNLADINQVYDNFKNEHDVKLAYRESLNITNYLIQNFGIPKVMKFLNSRKEGNELSDDLKKAFGLSYEELERRWLKSLKDEYVNN